VAESNGESDPPVLLIGPATFRGEASWMARTMTGEEQMIVEPVRSWYHAHERANQYRCSTVIFDDGVVAQMAALGCGPRAAGQVADTPLDSDGE
jgi:hypothetical protein